VGSPVATSAPTSSSSPSSGRSTEWSSSTRAPSRSSSSSSSAPTSTPTPRSSDRPERRKQRDMKTTALGSTGMVVSRLGFGSWAMSGPNSPSYWGPQDDEVSIATIRRGIEAGINWIDTAAIYGMGHAESVVARAVADFPSNDRPFVFTKGGLVWDKAGP